MASSTPLLPLPAPTLTPTISTPSPPSSSSLSSLSSSAPSTPSASTPPPSSSSTPPPVTSSTPTPPSSSSTTPPPSSSQPSSQPSSASSSSPPSSSSSSSSSFASSTPPPQTSSSSSFSGTSTTFQTTVITTDSQGSVVTISTTEVATSTPSTTHSNNTSTSHTGAIVGGTVGGVAGLAILGLLLLFCLRRQRRKDDFDGNFDPDRVGHSQAPLDLVAGEVEPYTFPHDPIEPAHQVDMREAALPVGGMHQYYNTSPSGQPDYGDSRSPTDTHTTGSYLSPNAAPVAGAAYAPSSSTSLTPSRSAKEHEAFSRYNTTGSAPGRPSGSAEPPGLHVMNSPDEGVVVHQDGGRVRIPVDDEQAEREIPPTYDSIPPDEARR